MQQVADPIPGGMWHVACGSCLRHYAFAMAKWIRVYSSFPCAAAHASEIYANALQFVPRFASLSPLSPSLFLSLAACAITRTLRPRHLLWHSIELDCASYTRSGRWPSRRTDTWRQKQRQQQRRRQRRRQRGQQRVVQIEIEKRLKLKCASSSVEESYETK